MSRFYPICCSVAAVFMSQFLNRRLLNTTNQYNEFIDQNQIANLETSWDV